MGVILNSSPAAAATLYIPTEKTSNTEDVQSHVDSSLADEIDPKKERAFLWRLDLGFLTVGFLGYMFKYLDQTNISNAYVSGMQEDLQLHGNQYNYFTTFFNIGYIIMLYPSCAIVSHIGPEKWLPACELIWGILTCCLSKATSAQQVYGLRFLIGFFEGSAWPGYFTIISQWYLPHEVALRMSLYNIAQPAGAMLSGALQGALSTNLEGVDGRAGWRWAFLINGVCTIVVALAAFFFLPGFPERPNPLSKFYLKPRHIDIALARARRVGRKPQVGLTFKTFFRCFSFWQLWAFGIAWSCGGNFTPVTFFNLWLKSLTNPDGSKKYSTAMLNYIPIAGQALQLVCELLFSGFSDLLGVRLPFLLLHSVINITSHVILIIRPANENAYMAGWFLNYIGGVETMLICAWASAYLEAEPQVRTMLFATGTVMSYILTATIPLAAFPASQAPNWKIGSKVYLGFMVAVTFLFVAIHYGLRWQTKKDAEVKAERGSDNDAADRPETVGGGEASPALAASEDKR